MSTHDAKRFGIVFGANVFNAIPKKSQEIGKTDFMQLLANNPQVIEAFNAMLSRVEGRCPPERMLYPKDPVLGDIRYAVENFRSQPDSVKECIRAFLYVVMDTDQFKSLTVSKRRIEYLWKTRFGLIQGAKTNQPLLTQAGQHYVGQYTPAQTGIRHETEKQGNAVIPSNLSAEVGQGHLTGESHPDAYMNNESVPLITSLHEAMSDLSTYQPSGITSKMTSETKQLGEQGNNKMAKQPMQLASHQEGKAQRGSLIAQRGAAASSTIQQVSHQNDQPKQWDAGSGPTVIGPLNSGGKTQFQKVGSKSKGRKSNGNGKMKQKQNEGMGMKKSKESLAGSTLNALWRLRHGQYPLLSSAQPGDRGYVSPAPQAPQHPVIQKTAAYVLNKGGQVLNVAGKAIAATMVGGPVAGLAQLYTIGSLTGLMAEISQDLFQQSRIYFTEPGRNLPDEYARDLSYLQNLSVRQLEMLLNSQYYAEREVGRSIAHTLQKIANGNDILGPGSSDRIDALVHYFDERENLIDEQLKQMPDDDHFRPITGLVPVNEEEEESWYEWLSGFWKPDDVKIDKNGETIAPKDGEGVAERYNPPILSAIANGAKNIAQSVWENVAPIVGPAWTVGEVTFLTLMSLADLALSQPGLDGSNLPGFSPDNVNSDDIAEDVIRVLGHHTPFVSRWANKTIAQRERWYNTTSEEIKQSYLKKHPELKTIDPNSTPNYPESGGKIDWSHIQRDPPPPALPPPTPPQQSSTSTPQQTVTPVPPASTVKNTSNSSDTGQLASTSQQSVGGSTDTPAGGVPSTTTLPNAQPEKNLAQYYAKWSNFQDRWTAKMGLNSSVNINWSDQPNIRSDPDLAADFEKMQEEGFSWDDSDYKTFREGKLRYDTEANEFEKEVFKHYTVEDARSIGGADDENVFNRVISNYSDLRDKYAIISGYRKHYYGDDYKPRYKFIQNPAGRTINTASEDILTDNNKGKRKTNSSGETSQTSLDPAQSTQKPIDAHSWAGRQAKKDADDASDRENTTVTAHPRSDADKGRRGLFKVHNNDPNVPTYLNGTATPDPSPQSKGKWSIYDTQNRQVQQGNQDLIDVSGKSVDQKGVALKNNKGAANSLEADAISSSAVQELDPRNSLIAVQANPGLLRSEFKEGNADIINEINQDPRAVLINQLNWLDFNNYSWDANEESDNVLKAMNLVDDLRRFGGPNDQEELLPQMNQDAIDEEYNQRQSEAFDLPMQIEKDSVETMQDTVPPPYNIEGPGSVDGVFHDVFIDPWALLSKENSWSRMSQIEGTQLPDSLLENHNRITGNDWSSVKQQNAFIQNTVL